jgi:hypothetical protein
MSVGFVLQKKVFGFEVTVRDAELVDVRESFGQLNVDIESF